jgi:hypothetical protein
MVGDEENRKRYQRAVEERWPRRAFEAEFVR